MCPTLEGPRRPSSVDLMFCCPVVPSRNDTSTGRCGFIRYMVQVPCRTCDGCWITRATTVDSNVFAFVAVTYVAHAFLHRALFCFGIGPRCWHPPRPICGRTTTEKGSKGSFQLEFSRAPIRVSLVCGVAIPFFHRGHMATLSFPATHISSTSRFLFESECHPLLW